MILQGDCRDVIPTLDAESVDAIVTDPPYELGFMGKAWDSTGVAYDVRTWEECYRVLKPGGHLLAFGGTRTYHRMAVAIEDAGFEIRDCIQWLYGSGFPKSLDVSKAIDKAAGALQHEGRGMQYNSGTGTASYRPTIDSRLYQRPAPATDAARQWAGWGTALKPAAEIICVARKPLVGTVAENVQAHGTGALNIDGCRIEAEKPTGWGGKAAGGNTWNDANSGLCRDGEARPVEGRWPANVILDPEAAAMLDEQSGESASTDRPRRNNTSLGSASGGIYGKAGAFIGAGYADSGGASRFFYVAKTARSERGEGNTHPTVKPVDLMRYLVRLVTPPGGIVLDPFAGSGTTLVAAQEEGFRWIACELLEEHIEIIRARTAQQSLFGGPAETEVA